jgi:hypothetical protein
MPHNIKQKTHFFPILKKFLTKLFHLLINTNNSIKNATTILEKASKKLEKKRKVKERTIIWRVKFLNGSNVK